MAKVGKQQTQFEGLEVGGLVVEVKKASAFVDEELAIGDVVSGTYKGHVIGVHYDQTKEGDLVRKHVVQVDRARVD